MSKSLMADARTVLGCNPMLERRERLEKEEQRALEGPRSIEEADALGHEPCPKKLK
jgi:hypothetical protein